jgi:hypothetical protein
MFSIHTKKKMRKLSSAHFKVCSFRKQIKEDKMFVGEVLEAFLEFDVSLIFLSLCVRLVRSGKSGSRICI